MTSSLFVDIRAALNGQTYSPAGVVLAVDGTAYPGAPGTPPPGAGFASDLVYGLMDAQDGLWAGGFVNYPAWTYPMGPSAQMGTAGLVSATMLWPLGTPIIWTGYSQGAMSVGYAWQNDVLNAAGVLHDRYLNGDFRAVFVFGDPLRCPGIANGNLLIGQDLPPEVDGFVTGGIAGPLCLTPTQTPDCYYSFANPGDMYADCPIGLNPWGSEAKVGRVETGIFNIVQQATFLDVISIAEDLFTPIATVEAIINAGSFFAQGTNAPHWHYEDALAGAIAKAVEIGNALPHQIGY